MWAQQTTKEWRDSELQCCKGGQGRKSTNRKCSTNISVTFTSVILTLFAWSLFYKRLLLELCESSIVLSVHKLVYGRSFLIPAANSFQNWMLRLDEHWILLEDTFREYWTVPTVSSRFICELHLGVKNTAHVVGLLLECAPSDGGRIRGYSLKPLYIENCLPYMLVYCVEVVFAQGTVQPTFTAWGGTLQEEIPN